MSYHDIVSFYVNNTLSIYPCTTLALDYCKIILSNSTLYRSFCFLCDIIVILIWINFTTIYPCLSFTITFMYLFSTLIAFGYWRRTSFISRHSEGFHSPRIQFELHVLYFVLCPAYFPFKLILEQTATVSSSPVLSISWLEYKKNPSDFKRTMGFIVQKFSHINLECKLCYQVLSAQNSQICIKRKCNWYFIVEPEEGNTWEHAERNIDSAYLLNQAQISSQVKTRFVVSR